MAKVSINSLLLLRRAYKVGAENEMVQSAASVMRKVSDSSSFGGEVPARPKEVFWMRDPKTGNWIPESHFDDIDVVELREKFLSKKEKTMKN
ncbi:unnamed protein product [Ilex paraguariensis]|uniref:Late embryogenesis abundant protein n=1 Tax=Ilex paraguariensis TaxID=185542 RepID=A0ABC8RPS9_9AQUA